MRTLLIATLLGTAMTASPVLAQDHGNSGGHNQSSAPPVSSTTGTDTTTTTSPTDMGPTTGTDTTSSGQGRVNSQGPANASPTGVAHANEHSVLASGSVASDTLPGLTTGLTVQSSTGTSLGTVSKIVTGKDGSIRQVYVTTSTGQTIKLPANSLTISGGVVTTTTTP